MDFQAAWAFRCYPNPGSSPSRFCRDPFFEIREFRKFAAARQSVTVVRTPHSLAGALRCV